MPDRPRLCPLDHGDEPRRAAPDLLLCWGHRNRIADNIGELPDLYDDLALRLHPDGPQLKPYTTGSGDTGPYINGAIADHRDLIWAGLAALARVVIEDRELHLYPVDSHPRTVARWLVPHVDWIAAQMFADDEAVNLHDLVRNGRRLAYPTGYRRIVCGRCVQIVACDLTTRSEQRCSGDLVAGWSPTADLEPPSIDCTVCGSSWDRRYWTDLGDTLREAS